MTTDPSLMIKQAVQFFLSQWYLGLQPSLVINTGYYGDIFLYQKSEAVNSHINLSSFGDVEVDNRLDNVDLINVVVHVILCLSVG